MSEYAEVPYEKVIRPSGNVIRPSEETMKRIKEENEKELKELPKTFLLNPWKFWAIILGSNSLVSFIGFSLIITIIICFFNFFDWLKAFLFTIIFCIWVGPVLFLSPLILMLIVPNVLTGNFFVPTGCGPRVVDGVYVDCI